MRRLFTTFVALVVIAAACSRPGRFNPNRWPNTDHGWYDLGQ